MRVPQGAYAHLVVGLDPVVELGGLPIPNVQLSVRISRHHVTKKRKEAVLRDRKNRSEDRFSIFNSSSFSLTKKNNSV